MAMIVFEPELSDLQAAVSGSTGVQREIGHALLQQLTVLTRELEVRFTSGISASKDKWATDYTSIFDAASAAEKAVSDSAGTRTANIYDVSFLLTVLNLPYSVFQRLLAPHRAAVIAAFDSGNRFAYTARGSHTRSVAELERAIYAILPDVRAFVRLAAIT